MKKITVCFIIIVLISSFAACSANIANDKDVKLESTSLIVDCNIYNINFDESLAINASGYAEALLLAIRENSQQRIVSYDYKAETKTEWGYAPLQDREIDFILADEANTAWTVETDNEEVYFLNQIDENGERKLEIPLDIEPDAYITSANCANNVFYFLCGDEILLYNKNGERINTLISPFEDSLALGTASNKTVYLTGVKRGSYYVVPIDSDTLSLGDIIETTNIAMNLFSGLPFGFDFCYYNHESLYGHSFEENKEYIILNWLDYGISGNEILKIFENDNHFLCLTYDGSYSIVELALGETKGNDTIELTLATYYASSEMMAQVAAFNKENADCKIVVKDYADYNIDGNLNTGITKLNTEIIAGHYPDIIEFTNMRSAIQIYSSKGLLENLYPFLEKDEELKKDDFVSSIQQALEIDGALYEAVPSFAVTTSVTADLGNKTDWDIQKMTSLLSEDTRLYGGLDTDSLIKAILQGTMESYIDRENKNTNFDSAAFVGLLEFFKLLQNDTSDGNPLIYYAGISTFLEIQKYEALLGEEVVFIGLPTNDESGNVAQIPLSVSITSKSKNKDIAWRFIRDFLTVNYQQEQAVGGAWLTFPTNKTVFEQMISASMEKEYRTDENGKKIEQSKGGEMSVDFSVRYYAATQRQIDKVLDLIRSVDGIYNFEECVIVTIVLEEAQAFFEGNKSASDVARNIQQRANIYINEQL